jgi:hypothetical protein
MRSYSEVLGAAIAVPAYAGAVAVLAKAEAAQAQDGEILAAWEVRQEAIAQIMKRGADFDAEDHSPELVKIFDDADRRITAAVASTARGALAQAWVHWSYVGDEFTPNNSRVGDLIRSADFAALDAEKGLDWEHVTMRQLVRSLRHLVGEA